jgi:methionyl-tRNA synthetase
MSKSLGNVISPFELVEKYGTEATRYLLLRHVHPVEDTDITWERLDEWYTANLVNGLGNLVARVMKLSEDYEVVSPEQFEFEATPNMRHHMNEFEFHDALGLVWQRIQMADRRITEEEPFKVIKLDSESGKLMIQLLVRDLFEIATMLRIFMPKTSEIILEAVRSNKKPENMFPRLT